MINPTTWYSIVFLKSGAGKFWDLAAAARIVRNAIFLRSHVRAAMRRAARCFICRKGKFAVFMHVRLKRINILIVRDAGSFRAIYGKKQEILPCHRRSLRRTLKCAWKTSGIRGRLDGKWVYAISFGIGCPLTWFLIASKLVRLITCSMRQASSMAISSGTPSFVSHAESSSWRS